MVSLFVKDYLREKQFTIKFIENRNSEFKSPPEVLSSSDNSQIKFASFLSKKGVVMYSAYWCPHCKDQKELFGKQASKKLQIVECAKDGKKNKFKFCLEKEIPGFPAWEIDNEIYLGVKTLKELSELTQYSGLNNL